MPLRSYTTAGDQRGGSLVTSSELSRAVGCRHAFDARQGQLVVVGDDRGRTSIEDVWSIGDGAGVAGARVARALGTLAAVDVLRSVRRRRASVGASFSPLATRRTCAEN